MKIKISFTVELDADEWATSEGIEKSEVREDVKNYLLNEIILPSAIVSIGALKVVN